MNRARMEAEREAMRAMGHETPGLDAALAKVPAATKPAWTPGPWAADETGCVYQSDREGRHYVKYHSPWREDAWESDAEAHANGRMFAAAPDLYEALTEILADMIGSMEEYGLDADQIDADPLVIKARAALAKAVQS